eukprot:31282-Pelagococcus_subviridis.AAC.13
MTRSFKSKKSHPASAIASSRFLTLAAMIFVFPLWHRTSASICRVSSTPTSEGSTPSPRQFALVSAARLAYHVFVRPTYVCSSAAFARIASAACSKQYTCVTWQWIPSSSKRRTASMPFHVAGTLNKILSETAIASSWNIAFIRFARATISSTVFALWTSTSTDTFPSTLSANSDARFTNVLSTTQSSRSASVPQFSTDEGRGSVQSNVGVELKGVS